MKQVEFYRWSVAEQGWRGFEMTQWYGLLAPASMAQPVADRRAKIKPD